MSSNRVSPASYSVYAPLRYEATRPFSVRVGEQYVRYSKLGLHERNHHLIHDIAPAMRKAMKVAGKPLGENAVLSEVNNMLAFGEFLKGGRVIYDFHKKLTSALLSTDVEEMPVSSLPKPEESLYIHFGSIESNTGEYDNLEGAFVSWRNIPGENETINIALVSKNQFAKSYYWLDESLEICTGSMFDVSDKSCNIIDCLQKSVDLVKRNHIEDNRELEAKYLAETGHKISLSDDVDYPHWRK